ncbi:uncharacterized protein LOC117586617 [Drosophila guanche]|uniref:Blast:Zinc finger protein 106 n=1 Tax=Drosophila guanche TaxID=7266 RepID=A0A3B0KFT7_DROGU|nr:uncharacterized protein LOC117586617 [Drosophila guanche]SPP83911.1 blast:Zinc finger protein 106 [Drosophila guanche]
MDATAQSNAYTGKSKAAEETAASVPTESSSSEQEPVPAPVLPAASAPGSPHDSRHGRDGSNWRHGDHWRHQQNSEHYGQRRMNEERVWDRDRDWDRVSDSFRQYSSNGYWRPPNDHHWQRNDYSDKYNNNYGEERFYRYDYKRKTSAEGYYKGPKISKNLDQYLESNQRKKTKNNCESKEASKADFCPLETQNESNENPENTKVLSELEEITKGWKNCSRKWYRPTITKTIDQSYNLNELKEAKSPYLLNTPINWRENTFCGQSVQETGAPGDDASQSEVPLEQYSLLEEFRKFFPQSAAESESYQTYPQIRVRPLAHLLRQEIQAVTEENCLGSTATAEKPATTPEKSSGVEKPANPLAHKPAPKNRGSTVYGVINEHLASLDKESLKNIIHNGDPIYDESLQFQARKLLRVEIRRQLKELEKPKDSPVRELIPDQIVDAIKFPTFLLHEIDFGPDISKPEEQEINFENIKIKTEPNIKSGECTEINSEPKYNSSPQCCPNKEQNSSPPEQDKSTECSKKCSEDMSTETVRMAGAKDLMARLKAADVLKCVTGVRQYSGRPKGSFPPRGPLVPFPKQNKKLNNIERPARIKISDSLAKNDKQKAPGYKGNSTAQGASPEPIIAIKQEIKDCEMVLPTMINTTIVVSSSSDEDEADEETTQQRENPKPVAKPNDDASDDSTSSQRSSESSKRRYLQKLKSDADNVVDSFEKLILPHLKQSLVETYRSQHCGSQYTRLHFISCVVTSSEYNSQSISKMEIAKVQKNLKQPNNRLGIEFLLRQIVHVVNQQKQQAAAQRRKEQEEQKLSNGISMVTRAGTGNAEVAKGTPSPPPHQRVVEETAVAAPLHNESPCQVSPPLSAYQSPLARESPPALPLLQNPPVLPPRQSPPVLPPRGINQPFGVFAPGIPFLDSTLSRVSPGVGGYGLAEPSEPMGLLDDMVAQNLIDIDRRLLENQNRRSFLDEMIMKFQKEKSDLEMHSLELQSRKFLLINSAISRKHGPTTATAVMLGTLPPTTSPAPTAEGQEAVLGESSIKNKAKPKGRFRRAVVVKYLPKRRAIFNRRAAKRNDNSDRLVAQLKLEMAAKEQTEKSKENSPEMPLPVIEPVIKEEPIDFCNAMEVQVQRPIITENGASHNHKRSAEPTLNPTSKPKQSRQSKPITSTVSGSNPSQQPLAIIPPLPPPPPPPEPIYNMPYELPRSILKAPPAPPTPLSLPQRNHSVQSNGNLDSDLGFIRKGRLHLVVSPITQIRIYKNYILAAAEDGDIYIFNLHNHKLERQIPKHGEAITNMHLCEQESFLYTTSLDGFLKKSSLENLESVQQTVYFKEPLQSIDIAWDAAFIGSRWGHIFVYNVVTNKMIDSPLLSTGQSIIAVKATKEGHRKIIILGCKGNFVYLHDAATGQLLRRLGVPNGLNVYSLLLNDGHIYCGTQKNEIYKFEFASGNLVTKLSCGNCAVSMVSFRDRYLLIGCYDGFIYVLDKHKGTQVGRFEGAGRLVLALAIAGGSIVTSSKDNSLEVLEVPPEMLNSEQQ